MNKDCDTCEWEWHNEVLSVCEACCGQMLDGHGAHAYWKPKWCLHTDEEEPC